MSAFTRLQQAAEEYLARQDRVRNPKGEFNAGNKWYPDPLEESRACCYHVRSPSHRWPYSLLTHCRSLPHVAELYGVDAKDLFRLVRTLRKGGGKSKT